jgi:hypothetical protein
MSQLPSAAEILAPWEDVGIKVVAARRRLMIIGEAELAGHIIDDFSRILFAQISDHKLVLHLEIQMPTFQIE